MSYLGLIAIFIAMFFICRELEKSCGAVAYRFGIPESVAGATLLAVSSSAPEFFTAMVGAVVFNSFEIGLMAILWSAIFNITVIPGVSALVSKKELVVVPEVVARDCVSYLAITLLLMGLLGDGRLTRTDALILLGSYFLYIYVLFLMLDADDKPEEVKLPGWRVIVGLVGGIALIGGLCHLMVDIGSHLAVAWAIPIGLVSALIFAPGTSVPDLFLSVFAARRGAGSAAVSNAFGSNSFDLTVCLAVPILVIGDVDIPFSGRALWSVYMLIGTVIVAMIFVRTGYALSKREGSLLIALFVALATVIVFVPDATPQPDRAPAAVVAPVEGGARGATPAPKTAAGQPGPRRARNPSSTSAGTPEAPEPGGK